ncbi:MAG TPA: SpoIIE family protein phosphatase [Acidimicrobiales bacterium]|nr:SpoIIE family protein phosphatase [Acidimicrobiales bacterium]
MPEPEGDAPLGGSGLPRPERTEGWATWVALLWVSMVAVVDAVFGGKFGLIGFLAVGPFMAAAFAGVRRTLLVGLYATFFSVILSTPPRQYDQLNHLLRVLTLVVSSGVAIWIAHLRNQRSEQLSSARTETRNERRRRVAAETAQRMQAMARALTTAADPAQVADAFFGAVRDELRVDAATFATTNERGVLTVHRRFGYGKDVSEDAVLAALDPDGAMGDVLGRHLALFADSVGDLRRDWPAVAASLDSTRFSSLAVVPLVVSDHAMGAVVIHWVKPRSITKADKGFLFTIAGAAAQAVERARLTMTEFTSLERTQHLHHLSSALAAATTPGDVARAAIAGGRRALGAQSAACRVPVAGERSLSCLASSGHPALLSRGDVPVDNTPSGSAFSQGRTLVSTLGVSETIDVDLAFEVVPRVVAELGEPVTLITEPLNGSVGSLGALTFAFVGRTDPNEAELRFLTTLAGLTAQALERAQLFEQEREALRDAESGRERLSLLSEVTKLLSSSLDPTTVMQRTMTLVVGRLADACVVQVPGESGLLRLEILGAGIFAPEAAQRVVGPEEMPFDWDTPAAIAYRTGRVQLASLSTDGIDPHDARAVRDSTALAIPLTANGEVIGVMTFVNAPGRPFAPDDVSLATEVASRTGVALSNATRFQREHVVAEVLQRAVLPDSLPTVAGLHFDAEYRAGAAGTYVGGDWYDVFALSDEQIVFSVGDVMGKGAPAAALMGQVRSAIRAYAVVGQSPSEVLSSLDRLFDALVEDRVVTVVVGHVNPHTGSVRLANAGHPPPLIVGADGTTSFTTAPTSLLIAAGLGAPERPSQEFDLSPGDALVMYSDGLVERRGELITVGMDRLVQEATAVARAGWPQQPAASLAALVSDDESADDVVVLALHYVGVAPEDRHEPSLGTDRDGMATLRLEPVVESTPMARHWINAHLRDTPTEVAECAALLTSELVTNAVLHAGTPLSVTLHLMSDRIRVDVADGSSVVPSIKDYGADAATGRGLTLFDTLASDWGVQIVDGGKIVWFELPVDYSVTPTGCSDGSFRFDLIGFAHAELHDVAEESPPVTIELLGIPVKLLQKASEEYEGLFRELRLMKEHAESSVLPSSTLPERLSVLVSEIGTRFHGFGPGMDDVWQGVVDRGQQTYNWRFELPQAAVVACEFYDAMLDEADEFGLSARLLTLPASSASVAVRRWFLAEMIGQLRGKPPIPWHESRFHARLTQHLAHT